MRDEKVFFLMAVLCFVPLINARSDTVESSDTENLSTTMTSSESSVTKSKATIGFIRDSSNSSESTTTTSKDDQAYVPNSSNTHSKFEGILPSTGETTQLLLFLVGILIISIIWLMIVYRNKNKQKRGESK